MTVGSRWVGSVLKLAKTELLGTKACRDSQTVAAIAVGLSQSSILCVEDLWSRERIEFVFNPEPKTTNREVLEEILIRSFDLYLRRPGHVLLPDGIISETEIERERKNPLLRVRKLWEYWHGSPTLDCRQTRTVSTLGNRLFHKKANSSYIRS